MIRLIVLVLTSMALAACEGRTPEPPECRTLLEFLEDEALLEKTWAACRNDPGGLAKTPDCANAGYTEERLMMLGRDRAIAGLKGKS